MRKDSPNDGNLVGLVLRRGRLDSTGMGDDADAGPRKFTGTVIRASPGRGQHFAASEFGAGKGEARSNFWPKNVFSKKSIVDMCCRASYHIRRVVDEPERENVPPHIIYTSRPQPHASYHSGSH